MCAVLGLFLVGVLPLVVAQTDAPTQTEYHTDRQIFTLETELSKLRRLHNQGKDRMRGMEREIVHYQSIFQGLRLLCSSLQRHDSQYEPMPTIEVPARSIQPTVSGIAANNVRTLVSPIGDRSVLQVAVSFTTTETYEVIWAYNVLGHMIPIQAGDPYSSWRTERQNGRYVTTLYIDTGYLSNIELLYLKILSEFSEVTILFNKDTLAYDSRVNLSPVKLWNELPSPEVLMLKPNQNATVVTNIDTNVQELNTFVNFIGIDTYSRPNKLLDIHIGNRRIQSVIENTTKGYKWSITVDSSLVALGGLMALRTVERFQSGPILQIHVGKTMYIISDKPGAIKAPFQPNSLGLLALYKSTKQVVEATKPIGAIWCYAFGNPVPKTSIIKYSLNGAPKVMEGYVYNIGKYDAAQVVIFRNVSREDAGTYICEARSGDSVVVEPINVYVS